jgi:hypothetical protein
MEDGTFNTKDEEEFSLPKDLKIGLIHPIELTEECLVQWKTQLEDYEIKQPFEQINRKVYRLKSEEQDAKTVERFGGIKINCLSLYGKLTKYGWYRGSIGDGAGYYEFYKENGKIGIGAELKFSGTSIGVDNVEITIYDLAFYKAGTVQRGSYIYDKIKDSDLLMQREVPERFFSEILYDVEKATVSKTGIDLNWKKESR